MLKKTIFMNVCVFAMYNFCHGNDIGSLFDRFIDQKLFASSYLIEKNMPKDFYDPWKAFDGDITTAWAEGIKGDGIGEYLVFDFFGTNDLQWFYIDYKNGPKKIDIKIYNGIVKNEKLFKENNRIKKATLEMYEAQMGGNLGRIFRQQNPILNSILQLNFKDSKDPQHFKFFFKPKQKPIDGDEDGIFFVMCKLTILEVYKGEKYQDTGISEIKISEVK